MKNKQVVLIVLDGWGHREEQDHNAIAKAKTPFFDYLWENFPHSLLEASGEHVGLPVGQMGNSEIGHLTIGAGKIIATDLVRISQAVKNRELSNNPAFLELFDHVRKHNSTLHIKGLVGPGGIHSHSEHLYGFLHAAKEAGITKIAIHAFTDGRDTPPQSATHYLKELEDLIEHLGIGFIATVSGRFYAMDRDHNWDRLAKAEEAIFDGKGKTVRGKKPSQVLKDLYQEGILDEHLEPVIFLDENGQDYQVQKNDGIFFFNFRADRARMLSQRIFERKADLNLCYVSLTEYDPTHNSLVAFPPTSIETTLAKEIDRAGLNQVHIAETEKFAHATYFLNGGQEKPHRNEEHILIESRKDIKTHDQAPDMRAEEIADSIIEFISKDTDFIFANFANPDMIGHTANREAIIQAIECVDRQLERIVEKALQHRTTMIITADHGNAEVNFDSETSEKHTAHTTNPVPFMVTDPNYALRNGNLADIAPTILEIFNLAKPKQMSGKSLLTSP
ncbi:MAG: 2,3-bisphosphoglycerate-independent phosphoglycerate mutase [Patescibacteria group bacterium]|jgi:2,3-bisphosphoglycerate-independent phosphoglycerate mutase